LQARRGTCALAGAPGRRTDAAIARPPRSPHKRRTRSASHLGGPRARGVGGHDRSAARGGALGASATSARGGSPSAGAAEVASGGCGSATAAGARSQQRAVSRGSLAGASSVGQHGHVATASGIIAAAQVPIAQPRPATTTAIATARAVSAVSRRGRDTRRLCARPGRPSNHHRRLRSRGRRRAIVDRSHQSWARPGDSAGLPVVMSAAASSRSGSAHTNTLVKPR
jgi:hypothetical protein